MSMKRVCYSTLSSSPLDLPFDLKYEAAQSSHEPSCSDILRKSKMQRQQQLADTTTHIDQEIKARRQDSVRMAAGFLRLGFLAALIFAPRWPDWQMTSLFTRGFRVAGLEASSNVYPRFASSAPGSVHLLLDPLEADAWNTSLSGDNRGSQLDTSVWQTARDEVKRQIPPKPATKEQVDARFGRAGHSQAWHIAK